MTIFISMMNTKISQILKSLMTERKITVAELARRVKLPQPTVHRIAVGICEHPHLSSLNPIASYFAITVEQLKGHAPIPWLDRIFKVPLLSWVEVLDWPANKNAIKNSESILTDANVSQNGFALRVKDVSMDPVFPKNSLLIVDPARQPKDRSYVIAKLMNHHEAIFRQLLVNAGDHYLKPLSPDFEQFEMTHLGLNDKILSVVVQAKRDCED